jgi:hypothetical protein
MQLSKSEEWMYCTRKLERLIYLQVMEAGRMFAGITSAALVVVVRGFKGEGEVHPRTGHEGPEGDLRYISYII